MHYEIEYYVKILSFYKINHLKKNHINNKPIINGIKLKLISFFFFFYLLYNIKSYHNFKSIK